MNKLVAEMPPWRFQPPSWVQQRIGSQRLRRYNVDPTNRGQVLTFCIFLATPEGTPSGDRNDREPKSPCEIRGGSVVNAAAVA